MRQITREFEIATSGKGLVEITRESLAVLRESGVAQGLMTVYCRHTSASLLIQENADASVQRDLARFFERIAPEGAAYEHDSEGPDDMPAHIRAALSQTSLSIPVVGGESALGTWQGIYLFEHRRAPHRRKIVVHVIGE